MLVFILVKGLICGAICAAIANSKGRSVVGWFFGGFFIDIIGIIIIACLSNLNEEDAERRRASQERRRLQEQLRQEKMKNESFRRHTYGRLDAHDRVLGVSTREAPELLGGPGGAPAALPGEGGESSRPEPVSAWQPGPAAPPAQWYFESSGTTRGPVTFEDLCSEIASGTVKSGTLVWTEALGDWTPAGRVTALQRALHPVKLEGTVVLDGLVEGTLPAGAEGRVREWAAALAPHGLDFNLEVDGDSFSLLPSSAPVAAARLGHQPAAVVKEALEQLLRTFPAAERASVFSTLRSAEVKTGAEVQTVYVVGPTGEVEIRERTVDADTRAAEPAVALRERLRIGAFFVVGLAALLGVASLFFDLRGALSGLVSKVTPLNAADIEVDTSAFEPWFAVVKKEGTPEGNGIVLTLERKDAFPKTEEEIVKLFEVVRDKTAVDWMRRLLAAEALARGRVHVDLFGKDGKVLGGGDVSILALRTQAKVEVEVRATRDPRTVRIALVP